MKLKFRKLILYPIMDKLFNYKTKPSNIKPMEIECNAHPATSNKLQDLDIRTITYNDWMKHIVYYNYNKMNRFERSFYLQKQIDLRYEIKK